MRRGAARERPPVLVRPHARLACEAADARHAATTGEGDDGDDTEGLGEEAETDALRDALQNLACLGRLALATTLPTLAALLASPEPLVAPPHGAGDWSSCAASLATAQAEASGGASSSQVALGLLGRRNRRGLLGRRNQPLALQKQNTNGESSDAHHLARAEAEAAWSQGGKASAPLIRCLTFTHAACRSEVSTDK